MIDSLTRHSSSCSRIYTYKDAPSSNSVQPGSAAQVGLLEPGYPRTLGIPLLRCIPSAADRRTTLGSGEDHYRAAQFLTVLSCHDNFYETGVELTGCTE